MKRLLPIAVTILVTLPVALPAQGRTLQRLTGRGEAAATAPSSADMVAQSIGQGTRAAILFTAPQCGDCPAYVSGVWESIPMAAWLAANTTTGLLVVATERTDLAVDLAIREAPTVVLLDGEGGELGRVVGIVEEAVLLRQLTTLRGNTSLAGIDMETARSFATSNEEAPSEIERLLRHLPRTMSVIESESAVEFLRGYLSHRERDVRREAANSLRRVSEDAYRQSLSETVAALRNPPEDPAAMRAVGRRASAFAGDPQILSSLEELAASAAADPRQREWALEVIADAGTSAALRVLMNRMVNEEDDGLRSMVLQHFVGAAAKQSAPAVRGAVVSALATRPAAENLSRAGATIDAEVERLGEDNAPAPLLALRQLLRRPPTDESAEGEVESATPESERRSQRLQEHENRIRDLIQRNRE